MKRDYPCLLRWFGYTWLTHEQCSMVGRKDSILFKLTDLDELEVLFGGIV